MGIERETFEYDEDGYAVYMDHILNSEKGLSFEQEAIKYLTFVGTGVPSMVTTDYFNRAEVQSDEMSGASYSQTLYLRKYGLRQVIRMKR